MRLFIATPLPHEIETYLGDVIEDLRPHGSGVKWVDPKNIHLTLRFLGESDEPVVPKIKSLIDRVASEFAAVPSKLSRLGGFPNLNRPRVIWVGLDGGVEELGKIARQLELGVRKLRFEPEKKKFKAHLTLGRVRDHRRLGGLSERLERHTIEQTSLSFDRIVLFKSTLTPRGPIYDRLHEAPLAG